MKKRLIGYFISRKSNYDQIKLNEYNFFKKNLLEKTVENFYQFCKGLKIQRNMEFRQCLSENYKLEKDLYNKKIVTYLRKEIFRFENENL